MQPSVALVQAARIPIATYRLQFNRSFTFVDARAIVPYLHALGISDCYASPYLCAVPGSPHGYDVVDPTRLNPEVGTDAHYWSWIEALRAHGMGHILDLVPNHMGIAKSANPWWLDVLEHGPSSCFAHVFDIEWHPVKAELADKVLLPILGDQYGGVLESSGLRVERRGGAFEAVYGDERLPIAPDTYPMIAGDLEAWIAAQGADVRADAEQLRQILADAGTLPPRTTREPGAMAARARDTAAIKQRLAALIERSAAVRAEIDARVARLNGRAGDPASFDALDRLLDAQSYRLANWRVASEEINYRRFFDINQLAAVRMEDPAVFELCHRFVFELVGRGGPTGLRIDHVDGLYAPADYLARLRTRTAEARPGAPPLFLIVEKILGPDEPLPRDWPVDGTTGYEFAAAANGLFVDGRNERAFDDLYRHVVHDRRKRPSFADLVYRCKKLIMHETMSGDINSLGHQLNRFSEHNRHFRDFTLYSLTATLREVMACFPVYRTYVRPGAPAGERDRRVIAEAIADARRRSSGIDAEVFAFVGRLLLMERALPPPDQEDERARLVGKFQQITGPVAAKAIEDTALYIYNRLVSLNEVGADPRVFGLGPAALHAWMARRQAEWPASLSTTATHDSKRGEDVRVRIDALSELPGAWKAAVARWRTVNRRFRTEIDGRPAPGANEEYLLYQTLVGAWPFEIEAAALPSFRERMIAYMIKALREANVHTSWLAPDEKYEQAAARFVASILDPRTGHAFLQAFVPFQARVAALGIYNSLSQLLIKTTAPGVPDFYQGAELWDLHLVDPDNRQPIDYAARRRILDALLAAEPDAGDLFARRTDGRLKMFVTARALAARARRRLLFERGGYVPAAAAGARQECVFAFLRRDDASAALTCVPRLIATLTPDAAVAPLGRAVWGDTRLQLPADLAGVPLRDVFTGAVHAARPDRASASLDVGEIFERLPVALLVTPIDAP
ncbi:MAG: malto-oligosyltrehalose synthase [Acidobacteria bacterium]|nr:malto-oligosyltrehalose synthase [Acidobacteriota bacterium]